MRVTIENQLEVDLGLLRLRYHDRVDAENTHLAGVWGMSQLPAGHLVVVGYEDSKCAEAATVLVEQLARAALHQEWSVLAVSGRDSQRRLRPSCLLGSRAVNHWCASVPDPEDPPFDARSHLGKLADLDPRLRVVALDSPMVEDLEDAMSRSAGMGLVLVDDVAGLAEALPAGGVKGGECRFDPTPIGLRRLSRQRGSAVVATVDWRLSDRWRWEREALTIVDLVAHQEFPSCRLNGPEDDVYIPNHS